MNGLTAGRALLRRRPVLAYVGVSVCLWAAGLLLAWPTLNAPFFGDDLHLIRTYSTDELRGVWQGPWDPDGVETAGFRPLTTWFNHLRASVFGESVVAQRVALLGLFAAYLTLIALMARWTWGADHTLGLAAGLLTLWHLDSVYHYFWISDGVHLLVGLCVAGAIALLLGYLRSQQIRWLVVSSALVAVALLTREDSLIVYPLLLLFGGAYLGQDRRWRTLARGPLMVYGVSVLVLGAGIWLWRGAAVDQAVPLSIDLAHYGWSLAQTVQNAGDVSNLLESWPVYEGLIRAWQVVLILLGLAALSLLPRTSKWRVLGWLVAMALAALPGLTMPRTNLLLMPVTFWSYGVAAMLIGLGRRSRVWAVVAMLVFGGVLIGSGWGSRILQAEARPANVEWICGQPAWVYGELAQAQVPAVRRAQIQAELAQYGIYSMADVGVRLPQIIQQAATAGRYTPDERGTPFIPRLSFIVYPDWRDWSCAVQTLQLAPPGG